MRNQEHSAQCNGGSGRDSRNSACEAIHILTLVRLEKASEARPPKLPISTLHATKLSLACPGDCLTRTSPWPN